MELTLQEACARAKLLKKLDFKDEYTIFVDNLSGKPTIIIQENVFHIIEREVKNGNN